MKRLLWYRLNIMQSCWIVSLCQLVINIADTSYTFCSYPLFRCYISRAFVSPEVFQTKDDSDVHERRICWKFQIIDVLSYMYILVNQSHTPFVISVNDRVFFLLNWLNWFINVQSAIMLLTQLDSSCKSNQLCRSSFPLHD